MEFKKCCVIGWKYNSITSGAACQSILFVMRKFMQVHFFSFLFEILKCTSITWHISSTSRVRSLSLIASRNCQRSMLKPKNWPLQVLTPLLPVPYIFYMCVRIWNFNSLEHWFEPAAIRLPLRSTLTEAGQTVDIEDAKHFLQSDKLLDDKTDEVVKNGMQLCISNTGLSVLWEFENYIISYNLWKLETIVFYMLLLENNQSRVMLLLLSCLLMICNSIKPCKESEVTHLILTMQLNVFVCLKFICSVSTSVLTSA